MPILDPQRRFATLSQAELDIAIESIPAEAQAWHAAELGQLAGCPGACLDCTHMATCHLAIKAQALWHERFTRTMVAVVVGVTLL